VGNRGPLRLVKDDDAPLQDAVPTEEPGGRPFSIGVSLAIWGLMAALAWGVVALVLHFL
jgi:hypothetical protein